MNTDRFAFLEEVFWPDTLKPMTVYLRYEDDSPTGSISVVIGDDGDAHITVFSKPDRNELRFGMRFRMEMTGGGQSPRVRNALLALAEAIRRDNEERPQSRG